MPMYFEWNEDKAVDNVRKHGVSFEEATTVFADTMSLTIHDPLHSEAEGRFIIVGMSNRHRTLVVVHTDRGDRVRIISARLATRRERKMYEEGE